MERVNWWLAFVFTAASVAAVDGILSYVTWGLLERGKDVDMSEMWWWYFALVIFGSAVLAVRRRP